MILSNEAQERKDTPVYSGVVRYFPLALAAVARLSKRGNDQHNPGEVLHWSREKSSDHPDCIMRHLIDEDWDAVAWRALAQLQLAEEKRIQREWTMYGTEAKEGDDAEHRKT